MPASPSPLPLRVALLLLWSALAIAVGASIAYYASAVALVASDVGSHLLGYAITLVLLLGIGAGNPWARTLFVLLLGWKLALVAFNLGLASTQLPWLYRLDQLILGLQLAGAALLFTRPVNAWFRTRGAA